MPADLQIYPKSLMQDWAALAANGDMRAQNNVAVTYCTGSSNPQDKGKGLKLFLAAADQGSNLAQYNIGVMHCVPGVGTVVDLNIAESWLLKAADQNFPLAHYRLGMIYLERAAVNGNPEDFIKAATYLEYAADRNIAPAQHQFAEILASSGPDSDHVRAAQYYDRAAARNHAPAIAKLGILTCLGKGVKKDMMRGVDLLLTAESRGNATAQYALGMLHEHGGYLGKNIEKAHELYRRAAAQGHKRATDKLAATMGAKLAATVYEGDPASRPTTPPAPFARTVSPT